MRPLHGIVVRVINRVNVRKGKEFAIAVEVPFRRSSVGFGYEG
jgi:hypothetical protein